MKKRNKILCVWLDKIYYASGETVDKGYETTHFLPALKELGYNVKLLNLEEISDSSLINTVNSWKPDYLLMLFYKQEISYEAIKYISDNTPCITVCWMGDDEHQFDIPQYWSSNRMAPNFNIVITTLPSMVERYKKIGCKNVIVSQWAANHRIFKPYKVKKDIDVSFCGWAHTDRPVLIQKLKDAGIDVKTFGAGWGHNSFIKIKEYVKIFSRSKININFGKTEGNKLQIKGRDFEVPMCGGFILTTHNPLLAKYFELNKEVATYKTFDELVKKIKYYLVHDDEREQMAMAGHKRAIEDHTYVSRFVGVLQQLDKYEKTKNTNN